MTTTCRLGTVDSDDNPWDYPSRIVTYVGAGEAIYEAEEGISGPAISLSTSTFYSIEKQKGDEGYSLYSIMNSSDSLKILPTTRSMLQTSIYPLLS